MATPQTLFTQGSGWRVSALSAAIGCALLVQPVHAQEAAPSPTAITAQKPFDIPAQQLRQALLTFSQQTGQNVMLDGNLDADLRSAPLRGLYSADQALAHLLAGSGFTFGRSDATTLYLVPLPRHADGNIELGATTINSAWSLGSTTEGSGSYTTGQTSAATRLDLSLRKTPQSISVMTRQQMDDQGLTNLSEVMQQTPGITVNRENSEGYTFYSRGFEIQNFQYDGVPSLSTDAGNLRDNYSITNSVIYDRVEILKGATGLVNGIGYPSGVINLVRKRPTAQFQGHVAAGAGSWDHYRTELDLSGPLLESGALRGRFVAATEQQHTFIDYQKNEQNIFYGVLDADLTDTTLVSVGYEYQENNNDASSTTHLPALYKNGQPVRFSRSTNPADKWAYRNHRTQRAFASIEQQFDNDWSLKATASLRNYASREIIAGLATAHVDQNDNSVAHGYYPGGAAKFNTDTDEKSLDVYAKGPFTLLGRSHDLVLGYNYANTTAQSNRTDGTTDLKVPDAFDWNNNAAYPTDWAWWSTFDIDTTQKVTYAAVVLKPTDALNFILGARATDYAWSLDSVNAAPRSSRTATRNTGEVIPYTGVTYDLDDHHTVYASYTDIFKPQPYNKGADNTPLEPLTGESYEVGIKGEYFDRRLNASLALFELKQDNLAVSTGVTGPLGNEVMRPIQGATTRGVELEMSGEIMPDWNVNAGYVYQESYDADDNRVATNQPQHLLKVATSYRLPAELNKLTVGGNWQWQSRTYFIDDSFVDEVTYKPLPSHKFTQDAYGVVGLMAAYDLNPHLKLSANLNNLFDKAYYSGIGNYYSVYYGNPRNVMFNVKYSF
ncbi:TonB-dependent siderophore receptor [Pseudomonas aegrilactucae]|uniref:TonB-dependent receptor n=1 Tax=Pseudomonas aegrilactucae TaxID=2854028 RepID=A0A9Q3ADR7_9PSED|nr:TonB-dependent receptor [Pseudomonas aegrilactucae]MBV6287734.1 TonB-dependent receptor [Pseudomonas aegrilactucae]